MAEQTNLQDVQPHSSGAVKPESASTEDPKHVNVQDGGREPLLPAMPSSTFNHNDPKYMCCCGCMHVRTGAIVIGILSWVFLCYHIAANLGGHINWMGIPLVSSSILNIPFVICLLVGAIIKNHILVLIYAIYGCIRMAIYALAGFACLVLMILAFVVHDTVSGAIFGALIALFCIEIAIAAWWTWVAFKCHRYLRDLKQQNGMIIGNEL